MSLLEQVPRHAPPLDSGFRPAVLGNQAFRRHVASLGRGPVLELCLVGQHDRVRRLSLPLSPRSEDVALNRRYAERSLKFALWQQGARRIHVAGPAHVARYLAETYSQQGARGFDADFMRDVYQLANFEVAVTERVRLPQACERSRRLASRLDGCRIGFDAGGSDRKVAALIDGRQVYADETRWHPKLNDDPQYHFDGIMDSVLKARAQLPGLDALGVSSAGIYMDNETRVASLFRKVPRDLFESRVRRIYLDVAAELGVPVRVENDGDVAALAGALALGDKPVLGLALGTSLAVGYIDAAGNITGDINELAFAPVDYSADAAVDDEWSGDRGVASSYLSQDAAIRLAAGAGLELPESLSAARKLVVLQQAFEQGHEAARAVYESLGVYLGYALWQFSESYPTKHVLLMGRVLSGAGGDSDLGRRACCARARSSRVRGSGIASPARRARAPRWAVRGRSEPGGALSESTHHDSELLAIRLSSLRARRGGQRVGFGANHTPGHRRSRRRSRDLGHRWHPGMLQP